MRSQLDCYDPRLPGTGVFDIKTRAALPIRMDLMNWEVRSDEVHLPKYIQQILCITGKLRVSHPHPARTYGEL